MIKSIASGDDLFYSGHKTDWKDIETIASSFEDPVYEILKKSTDLIVIWNKIHKEVLIFQSFKVVSKKKEKEEIC